MVRRCVTSAVIVGLLAIVLISMFARDPAVLDRATRLTPFSAEDSYDWISESQLLVFPYKEKVPGVHRLNLGGQPEPLTHLNTLVKQELSLGADGLSPNKHWIHGLSQTGRRNRQGFFSLGGRAKELFGEPGARNPIGRLWMDSRQLSLCLCPFRWQRRSAIWKPCSDRAEAQN